MNLTLDQQKRRQEGIVNLLRSQTSYFLEHLNDKVLINDVLLPFVRQVSGGICCISASGTSTCPTQWNIRELGTRGKVGVPYIVTRGGSRLLVKLSKFEGSAITYDKSKNVVVTDEFTNETLLAYILNYVFDRERVPLLVVRHLDSIYCPLTKTGYNIMELANGGNLKQFDRLLMGLSTDIRVFVVDQILKQILVCIHFLQQRCAFTSGDLKAENIVIDYSPINVNYRVDGGSIDLNANFRCLLIDFGKSSVSVTDVQRGQQFRLHSDNTLFSVYTSLRGEDDIDISSSTYTLTSIPQLVLAHARHGSKRFYPSFDWYTLMMSLLTLPGFRDVMFGTCDCERGTLIDRWWTPLWQDCTQEDRMRNKILNYVQSGARSINQSVELLRNEVLKMELGDMLTSASM